MPYGPWLLAPASALLSLGVGYSYYRFVKRQDRGTARMQEIAGLIRAGARAFIRREYRVLAMFVGAMTLVLFAFVPEPIWTPGATAGRHVATALAYVLGSVCSAAAGVFGMSVATQANVRAAAAARRGLAAAFAVGFRGGAVMGMSVVGLGLLGVSVVYALTGDPETLIGYGFGASSIALFAKAGGGIFTKTADIAADLAGKIELGIPEDDPRNPAVIADNVGDNVGDVAGMGADLLDSYVASLLAAMVLGGAIQRQGWVQIPLVFAAVGVVASVLGTRVARVRTRPSRALNLGTHVACLAFAALSAVAVAVLGFEWRVWGAAMAGLVAGSIIGFTTDHFTGEESGPVVKTAAASETGAAINVITGFAFGLRSVMPSLAGVAAAAVVSYQLCAPLGGFAYGVFGIAMAALGMLAIVGLTVSNDAYGPIVDNARGIVEQAGLGDDVLAITDRMDAAGNAAKAITKGFAIGAAGLTVLALLATFRTIAAKSGVPLELSLLDPWVLGGILIGLAVPAVFSARVILGVSRNAHRMIEEVRRQFREIPGLREGDPDARPDYDRCIQLATSGAMAELLPASLTAVGVTVVVGFVGGLAAMGGCLAGAIFGSLPLGLLMANAGGLWDNAKKRIESGHHGGRGSDAHKAAVVGDTVGDPFKDTAGPSLNTMVAAMSLIATLLADTIGRYNLAAWLR